MKLLAFTFLMVFSLSSFALDCGGECPESAEQCSTNSPTQCIGEGKCCGPNPPAPQVAVTNTAATQSQGCGPRVSGETIEGENEALENNASAE